MVTGLVWIRWNLGFMLELVLLWPRLDGGVIWRKVWKLGTRGLAGTNASTFPWQRELGKGGGDLRDKRAVLLRAC